VGVIVPAGHSGKERHCAHGLYQATEWGAKKKALKREAVLEKESIIKDVQLVASWPPSF
jgi:hypothetical protein